MCTRLTFKANNKFRSQPKNNFFKIPITETSLEIRRGRRKVNLYRSRYECNICKDYT